MQLLAEELAAALEESSAGAVRRLPKAREELRRVTEESQRLREQAAEAFSRLNGAAEGSGQAVARLEALHRAREGLAQARDTLREAAGLAGLFNSVEGVFRAGDLPRAGEALAAIARGLRAVGDVPEFASGEARLRRLEERLEGMAGGPLREALRARDGAKVRELAGVLAQAGRGGALAEVYALSQLPALRAPWDAFGAAAAATPPPPGGTPPAPREPFPLWLQGFLTQTLRAVRGEAEWLSGALPNGQGRALLAGLVRRLFQEVAPGFTKRLEASIATAATAFVTGASSVSPVEALLETQNALRAFVLDLAPLLPAHGPAAALEGGAVAGGAPGGGEAGGGFGAPALLRVLYGPVAPQLAKFEQLARRDLEVRLQRAAGGALRPGGKQAEMAQALAGAPAAAGKALQKGLVWGRELGGGLLFPEALGALDAGFVAFAGLAEDALRGALGSAAGKQGHAAAPAAGGGTASSEESLALALRLVGAVGTAEREVDLMNAQCQEALDALQAVPAQASASDEGPVDAAAERAIWSELLPAHAVSLGRLLARTGGGAVSSQGLLAQAPKAAAALVLAADQGAVEAALAPAHRLLRSLPGLPEYARETGAGGEGGDQPSFSVLPSQVVTDVGEYLLVLPGQLEAAGEETLRATLREGSADAAAIIAGEDPAAVWMARIGAAAATAFFEAAVRIPRLSPAGAKQLAADLDYFGNVASAVMGGGEEAGASGGEGDSLLPLRTLQEGLAAGARLSAADAPRHWDRRALRELLRMLGRGS